MVRDYFSEPATGIEVDIAANGGNFSVGLLQDVHEWEKHQIQIGINGIVHQIAWKIGNIISVKTANIDHNTPAAASALWHGDDRINPRDVLPVPQQGTCER